MGADKGPEHGQGTPRTGPGPNVFAGGGVVAAGSPVRGQARWGRGPQRRAAFSSPSWIAGRFECFLWMRHLPKVGE